MEITAIIIAIFAIGLLANKLFLTFESEETKKYRHERLREHLKFSQEETRRRGRELKKISKIKQRDFRQSTKERLPSSEKLSSSCHEVS